jgi:hypothetical protein
VGRQGFEPWKPSGSRFTVCPLCPLGYLPVRPSFQTQWNFNPAGKSETQAASILIVENEKVTPCTAPQQVIDGWLAEDDEDWPGIESI